MFGKDCRKQQTIMDIKNRSRICIWTIEIIQKSSKHIAYLQWWEEILLDIIDSKKDSTG